MKGSDLLEQAQRLARATQRRPRRVDMNRAVSTIYYALFHTLARLGADIVVGTGNARRDAWVQTYRTLDHGATKKACVQASNRGFPIEIVEFAELFVELQDKRHSADYDPTATFKRVDVIALIARAELAMAGMRSAARPELRAFVVLALLPARRR